MKTFISDVRRHVLGKPTKASHWLGRVLYLSMWVSFLFFIFPSKVIGDFTTAGLAFMLIGLIQVLSGLGIEMFPPEVVEYQSRPKLAAEASMFTKPGEGTLTGLMWLAIGVICSWRTDW